MLVKLASGSPEQIELTHNISASGLMVNLARAMPEGARIEVTITSLTPAFNAPAGGGVALRQAGLTSACVLLMRMIFLQCAW